VDKEGFVTVTNRKERMSKSSQDPSTLGNTDENCNLFFSKRNKGNKVGVKRDQG